ncbi:BTAD domain-containing putative transcriptional regulator [Streptomyces sp. 8N616]|uniref:BTAD domain-containing putative transcriptional regulator n=1 Tax=Streptomyces sp. 8N616 TaxID=3457414 RepID=UPI003FCF1D88
MNRVVATSQLLNALWPMDDAPISARKILQNAIWGLRRALPSKQGGTGATLVTQPPGYRLTVDPDDVDLYRFQRMVETGRAKLAEGAPQEAALLLRDALALWRGPVLADLAEAGIAWPELSAVQNARLDVMEDYFEAELACGRHSAVLGELEAMVEKTALRERSCGQLMTALYRSGRQADALNVYSRVRRMLVGDLGLEPSRDLQMLQQAILTQDPSLNLPQGLAVRGGPRRVVTLTGRAAESARRIAEGGPTVSGAVVAPPRPETANESGRPVPNESGRPVRAGEEKPATVPARQARPVRRRRVNVLLVRAQLAAEAGDIHAGGAIHAEDIDETLERASCWIEETIQHFGGTVTAGIGSIAMAVFDSGGERMDGAERAVLAALAIRDGLDAPHGPLGQSSAVGPVLSFRAAVAAGEASVHYRTTDSDGAPAAITGALLEGCTSLLSRAAAGQILVCGSTRDVTESMIDYRADGTGAWEARGIRADSVDLEAMPTAEWEAVRGVDAASWTGRGTGLPCVS